MHLDAFAAANISSSFTQKKIALKSFQLVIERTHSVNIASLYLKYDSAQGHQNSTKYKTRAALY